MQLFVDPIGLVIVALVFLGALGLVLTWLADRAVAKLLDPARARPIAADAPSPPISILKPLKGVDDGLRENLASIFSQRYPRFEVLLGAEDPREPALAIARQVAAEYPGVPMRIVVCPADGGLNPKVSILRRLSGLASHDLVLISDSNVRARPGYLRASVAELSGDVALVTHLVASQGERGVAALMEGLHLVTFVARAMAFATVCLRRPCVVGKSMLFRLSALTRVGGWGLVRDILAEDYAIGEAFRRSGLQVIHASQVLFTFNRRWPLSRFVNRHLRWGQMRRRVCLGAYLGEWLFNPAPILLLAATLGVALGRAPSWLIPVCGLGITLRLWADCRAWRRMRSEPAPLSAVLLALPKDVLVLALWFVAAVRRTIDWRGNRLRVGPGSRLERIQSERRALEEVA